MTRSRIALLAVLAVLAGAAGIAVPQLRATAAPAAPSEAEARARIERYRVDAVAALSRDFTYAREAITTFQACAGTPQQYLISARWDLASAPGVDGSVAVDALRKHWAGLGYDVVNDTPGQNAQLLTEDEDTGFRVGISRRAANFLRLAVSSPCVTLPYVPVEPVLPQEQASVREAYQAYVAGVLDRLTADLAALRAALDRDDLAKARAAWLAAQLTWDRVGAAYGSFGDYTDAIDGLPQGLPGGVRDPHFTGLRRVEYGLWHGEALAGLEPIVDAVATSVTGLSADLPGSTPDAADLPLRLHEILEDTLRFGYAGLTDMGGDSVLAETAASVDATKALLDLFGPLLDERRPELRPAAQAQLAGLRTLVLAHEGSTVTPDVEAALGRLLETLAEAPGLLEVSGS